MLDEASALRIHTHSILREIMGGQQTASPMFTAIMSGEVRISGREVSTQLINSLEQAIHNFSYPASHKLCEHGGWASM